MAQTRPPGATAEGLERSEEAMSATPHTRRRVSDDPVGRNDAYHRHRLEGDYGRDER